MRDNSGQILAYCDTGLIPGSDCTGGTPVAPVYEYSYDALGRAYAINNHYLNLVQSYGFDAFGNRKFMTVKRGTDTLISFSYAYTPTDRLLSMTDNRTGGITSFTFTDAGRMSTLLHSNLTQTDYTYNPSTGQLSSIDHLRSDGSEILTLDYAYDARNNITSKVIDGVPTNYGYDPKSQLTSVQVASTQTEDYSYDGKGNRLTSLEYPDWNYNPGDQLTDYNGHTFTYDSNGNMTTINTAGQIEDLEYSVDDRLAKYNKLGAPGTVALYNYDLYSLRLKKEINFTDTTYYLYDGTVLLAELDSAKTISRYYGFMPGSYFPLSLNDVSGSNISTHVYHNDHLMTPLRLTDSLESISWFANYESFGKVNIITENVINNLRFPGQWEDFESGFYYNHYRYYIPNLGRYINMDSLKIGYLINLILSYNKELRFVFNRNRFIIPSYRQISSLGIVNPFDVLLINIINKQMSVQNSKYGYYTYSSNNPLMLFDPLGLYEDCFSCKLAMHIGFSLVCFIGCIAAEIGTPVAHLLCDAVCELAVVFFVDWWCEDVLHCIPPPCPEKESKD